jgi:hypothetical protein
MPNHYKKNVFPLFMDDREPVQEITTEGTDKEWNGVTSRVLIAPSPVGDVEITLGKPETPGIMVEIGKDNGDFSCIVNMDPYGPFANDADFREVDLQYGGDGTDSAAVFTCFWNGENWVPIGLTATT